MWRWPFQRKGFVSVPAGNPLDAAQEGAGGTLDAYLEAAGLQLTQINQVHAPGRNIECVRESETLR